MTPRQWLRWLWEDAKAWRRGERRVASRGARGRIYRRKADQGASASRPPNAVTVRPEPYAVVTPVRVYRAAKGRWCDIDNKTGRHAGPKSGD